MLELEASYLPFKSLFKILRQIWQSTIHLVYLPVVSSDEILYPCWILGQKIACFYASEGFPNKHECKKNIYGNSANFRPRAIVNSSCRKNSELQKSVFWQTALCTCNYWRAITEPVREYFAHFRYQPSHFEHTLFINAYWWAEPVPRDLKLNSVCADDVTKLPAAVMLEDWRNQNLWLKQQKSSLWCWQIMVKISKAK